MISNYLTSALCTHLKENVPSRDDMMLCVKHIHDLEMRLQGIRNEHYYDAVFNYKLSSIKTIDRIWRKLQEDIPELRGAEWELRQAQAGRIEIEDLSHMRHQLNMFE